MHAERARRDEQLAGSRIGLAGEDMELAELAALNVIDVEEDDKCPFCYKKPKGHATKKKPSEINDKVKSIPSGLGIDVETRKTGDRPYTTAAHHLISAMQCYKQVRTLVRMGNMVGYDINAKPNGIGLPTTHWTLKYPQRGARVKYGDLDEPEGKKEVAFDLMKELGAQWHVGHHAFEVVVRKKDLESWKETGADEKDEEDAPHETSYDVEVINLLLNLLKSMPSDLCEDPKKDDKFKEDMDAISKEIRTKLEKFKKGSNPVDSTPFFVSMRAYEYSGIAKTLKPKIKMRGGSL
jgi:hypothetical protein